MSKLLQNIVNGKVIATGKGGHEPGKPWATVVCDIKSKELIYVTWYENEELARLGHRQTRLKFGGKM